MYNFLLLAAALVVSYAATHMLVVWLQRLRLSRIESKSRALCGEDVAAASGDGSIRRVPITLITGFLGSGKTTLVNRVLTSPDHGLRVLVIENELGAVSIDHALIDNTKQAALPDGVVVLKNGCMCCSGETPGSELERVLDKLLEMGQLDHGKLDDSRLPADVSGNGTVGERVGSTAPVAELPFDYVLIETTGLADPSPIVQILARREMERSRFYLDAVVAVVDAANVLRHLRPSGPFGFVRRRAEAEKQIALADRIILNKVGLLCGQPAAGAEGDQQARTGGEAGGSEALAPVLAAVRRVNASAGVLHADYADVPLSELLDLRAFSSARWLSHAAADAEERYAHDAAHAASVTCVSLTLDAPIALPRLQAWLQRLMEKRHEDVYRIKGVLAIAGAPERFVLHGVHADVHGAFERPWAPGEVRSSSLVVIGHRLDRDELTAAFRATADSSGEQTQTQLEHELEQLPGADHVHEHDHDASTASRSLRKRNVL